MDKIRIKPKKKIRKIIRSKKLKLDINKLEILGRKIVECNKCSNLRKNGIAVPSWSEDTKYGIILEAPGREEIEIGKLRGFPIDKITGSRIGCPLIGPAGRLMWNNIWDRLALERKDFLVLNSTQCRPVKNGRNGKPTYEEIGNCNFWVYKYLAYSGIKHLLVCGNLAYWLFSGKEVGITKRCGEMHKAYIPTSIKRGRYINIYPCIHPASVLYHKENLKFLQKSLEKFKKGIAEEII